MKACARCGERHQTAAEVRACFQAPLPKRSSAPDDMRKGGITERQESFVRAMMLEIGMNEAELDQPVRDHSKEEASALIEQLMGLRQEFHAKMREMRARNPKGNGSDRNGPSAPVLTDGMYRLEDGTIYKVQYAVHGSGNLYAKRLVVVSDAVREGCDWKFANGDNAQCENCGQIFDNTEEFEAHFGKGKIIQPAVIQFDYEPGAIGRLRPENRMTLEEAKQFGALYGTCVRCGRTLTREESIERAMGPVCAGRI